MSSDSLYAEDCGVNSGLECGKTNPVPLGALDDTRSASGGTIYLAMVYNIAEIAYVEISTAACTLGEVRISEGGSTNTWGQLGSNGYVMTPTRVPSVRSGLEDWPSREHSGPAAD